MCRKPLLKPHTPKARIARYVPRACRHWPHIRRSLSGNATLAQKVLGNTHAPLAIGPNNLPEPQHFELRQGVHHHATPWVAKQALGNTQRSQPGTQWRQAKSWQPRSPGESAQALDRRECAGQSPRTPRLAPMYAQRDATNNERTDANSSQTSYEARRQSTPHDTRSAPHPPSPPTSQASELLPRMRFCPPTQPLRRRAGCAALCPAWNACQN